MELAAPLKERGTFSPKAYLAKVGPERRLRLTSRGFYLKYPEPSAVWSEGLLPRSVSKKTFCRRSPSGLASDPSGAPAEGSIQALSSSAALATSHVTLTYPAGEDTCTALP